MKWKKELIGVGISLICTILIAMYCSKFVAFDNLIIMCLPIFCMFLIISLALYAIINKISIKISVWLLGLGVNGVIMVISAALRNLICFIITFVVIVGLMVVGFRMEDKK